jgi:diguanylate cyclase (GGDEF)-like protein
LLCVDVDAFSAINDIFGHGKADTLLCDVAELLKSVFATEDGIARYGSDQFVVVVPKSLFVGRDNVQEKLAQALKAREIGLYHASAGNFHVSLTLGAAGFPEAGGNFASVFLAAERDLREQKALKKLKPFSDQNAQLLPQAA